MGDKTFLWGVEGVEVNRKIPFFAGVWGCGGTKFSFVGGV